MPIIGNPLNSVAFLTDSFNGNGSTTAFTMSVAPATSSSILVNITGVTQAPSTYSVVGTTLTFSTAPPSGTANISVRYLGIPASGVTTTAYRTLTEFTATASQTTFTPPSYTVGFIAVYQNGVMLGSADYTASNGTTVVLAVGALVNDLISTESFYVSSVLNALPVTGGTIGGNLVVTGTTTLTGGLNTPLAVTSGGTGVATSTGSGANVLGTSPTLTTPTISSLSSASATALTLQSAGTTAVTIDTSQNVGIGTSSPSDKLNMVVSSSSVDPVFGGTSNQGIRLQNSNATVGNFTSILNVNSAGTQSSMIAFRNVDQNTPNTAGAIDFVTRNGGTLYRAMTVSQDGNLLFNSGYGSAATAYGCRAWVNFNGTGTVAIRASGNVSSITDNGTGDYTVNFTTAMVDANYSVAMIGTWDVTISTDQYFCGIRASSKTPTTKTASALRLMSGQSSTSAVDSQNQSVSIFR